MSTPPLPPPQPADGPPPYGPPPGGQPHYGPPPGGQPHYGQPPAGQPQYGQPQYGSPPGEQPYGPPSGEPAYGPPPGGQPDFGPPPQPQPATKKPFWKQPVVYIVAVLLVAGIVAWLLSRDNVQNADVGDCIQIQTETDFRIVDCGSDEASFKVLSVQDGGTDSCTDLDVDSTIYSKGGAEKAWCLRMVVDVGDCIESDADKVDCGSPTAEYKVLEMLTNTTDDTDCPADATLSRPYTADNSVLCLGPAA